MARIRWLGTFYRRGPPHRLHVPRRRGEARADLKRQEYKRTLI